MYGFKIFWFKSLWLFSKNRKFKNLKIFGIQKNIENFYGDVANINQFEKLLKRLNQQLFFI